MSSFAQIKRPTSRLLMRPLVPSDAESLFGIFSDPQVMRYWSTPPWVTIDDAIVLIAREAEAMSISKHIRLGIERTSDRRLIGTCSLFNFDQQCRRAEIGYALASAAWGHGYMHECLASIVEYGFSELALNRIEADIDPRNVASAKSLERLGFQKEGFLRERWIVNGEVSDSGLYGLLASDWQAKKFDTA